MAFRGIPYYDEYCPDGSKKPLRNQSLGTWPVKLCYISKHFMIYHLHTWSWLRIDAEAELLLAFGL